MLQRLIDAIGYQLLNVERWQRKLKRQIIPEFILGIKIVFDAARIWWFLITNPKTLKRDLYEDLFWEFLSDNF